MQNNKNAPVLTMQYLFQTVKYALKKTLKTNLC